MQALMAQAHLNRLDEAQSDRKAEEGKKNETISEQRTILNPDIVTTTEGILSSFGDYEESNLSVRIIGTQEVRGRVFKHILFTIQSSLNEHITVCRRYNDFKWLHATLSIEYCCVVIPPIGTPDHMSNILNKFDKEFVAQRRYELQRFLNRVFSDKLLSQSQSFMQFLTQQSHVRFVEQQTVIKETLLQRTDKEIEEFIKNKCFPDSDFADEDDGKYERETLDDEVLKEREDAMVYLEQIPRIREVYMRCNERLIGINKIANNVFKTMTQIVLEINTITEELYGLYDMERKEKPEMMKDGCIWHKRVEINAFMNKWKQCKQHQMYCYYKYFVLNLKHQHLDCLAILDVFARYDSVYNKYKKMVNEKQSNQYKYPRYEMDPEADQQKKIKNIKSLLNVVCTIILKEQVPKLWEEKIDRFNAQIEQFQDRISEYTLND